MSLKTAFAAVLKAMRNSRGLTQKHLSEASSRTYLSKLERGQSSLTLDKLYALSQTLELSPLTLVAITLGTEARVPLSDLVSRLENELVDLRCAGVLSELGIELKVGSMLCTEKARPVGRKSVSSSHLQTELCFSD